MIASVRRAPLALLLGLSLLLGCHRSTESGARRVPPRRVTPSARPPETAPEPPIYDADGNLLASDAAFMGLPIPVSFTLASNAGGTIRYESPRVPIGKLRAYVASRVETTNVPAIGVSAYYFETATVRGVANGDHRLDIAVLNASNGVALELRDRAPVDYGENVTQAERERLIREAWRRESTRE